MNPVQGFSIPAVPSPPAVPRADAAAGAPQTTFKDLLLDGIQQVNSMQQQADVAVQQ